MVTLREMSAKLWLEIGGADRNARTALPNSQLLLSCDRALKFNRKVVDKAREELRKVKSDQLQQFELLLDVPRSARAVMDFTLNNEKHITSGNMDQLMEAAIQAAAADVGDRARIDRAKDRDKFKRELLIADQQTQKEKSRFEEQVLVAEAALADKTAVERTIRDTDIAMLEAIGLSATERFAIHKSIVQCVSVAIALAPLVLTIWAFFERGVSFVIILGATITCLLAGATAMDRPGAWLSKIIHRRICKRVDKQLRDVGRHDLAYAIVLSWTNGNAVADLVQE